MAIVVDMAMIMIEAALDDYMVSGLIAPAIVSGLGLYYRINNCCDQHAMICGFLTATVSRKRRSWTQLLADTYKDVV